MKLNLEITDSEYKIISRVQKVMAEKITLLYKKNFVFFRHGYRPDLGYVLVLREQQNPEPAFCFGLPQVYRKSQPFLHSSFYWIFKF